MRKKNDEFNFRNTSIIIVTNQENVDSQDKKEKKKRIFLYVFMSHIQKEISGTLMVTFDNFAWASIHNNHPFYSYTITSGYTKLRITNDLQNQESLISIFFLVFLGPHLWHMEVPRLGGPIGGVAVGLHHSHSNTSSEPWLQPIPQLIATPDP